MQNTDLWLRFPPHLEMPARRSLSLAFILEELLKTEKNYDRLNYYCGILSKDDALQKEVLQLQIANLQGLQEDLRPFFGVLIPFLFESRTDENILIKLLELKSGLNQKLGPNTIESLLLNFSPLGIAYLKTIISEGLTRRGFTSFLAEKEHLFDTIELCPLPN